MQQVQQAGPQVAPQQLGTPAHPRCARTRVEHGIEGLHLVRRRHAAVQDLQRRHTRAVDHSILGSRHRQAARAGAEVQQRAADVVDAHCARRAGASGWGHFLRSAPTQTKPRRSLLPGPRFCTLSRSQTHSPTLPLTPPTRLGVCLCGHRDEIGLVLQAPAAQAGLQARHRSPAPLVQRQPRVGAHAGGEGARALEAQGQAQAGQAAERRRA